MTTGKLWLTAVLGVMPAVAAAQPSVRVDVGVNVGGDTYDTVAPGDPVEAVDVFYDQLSPYGVWVDEPDVGRVFVPETANYVPYTTGHWEYTNLGFVWISTEPYAWATSHYGRWAYSRYYGRWYWLPDTSWGPAWVEWRTAGNDFGWAPLGPDVVVRAGWQPPVDAWHYCSAEHVLDVNLVRYYEPRERVVEIHRAARPVEHYATVSNVRVAVGPPAAVLRQRHVEVHPVRIEARTVGRWTGGEAHAQAERAREHRATFEVQNQRRLEANTRLHTAHVKVIEAHPQLKAQVTARVQAAGHPAEPNRSSPAGAAPAPTGRVEPGHTEPNRRVNPNGRTEPNRAEPNRAEPNRAEPNRAEPNRGEPHRAEPNRVEPNRRAEPNAPSAPNGRAEPNRVEPARPEPRPAEHAPAPRPPEPRPAEHAPAPRTPEPRPGERRAIEHASPPPPAATPKPPEQAPRAEQRTPEHAPPAQHGEPRATERKEPARGEPDRKPADRKEPDRKDSDRH
ncbi:MAG TPA: DUF6600 domain-containing protein [Kofleriaceae bacterium]